jgi:hypothetical protein
MDPSLLYDAYLKDMKSEIRAAARAALEYKLLTGELPALE